MAIREITLREYASDLENVVIFWAGIGTPMGDYAPLGHPGMDFAERNGLLDLLGFVDEEGNWQWWGTESPTDNLGNTITLIQAYSDRKKWASLIAEYESEV